MKIPHSQAIPDGTDSQAVKGALPGAVVRLQGWNGTTFNRIGAFQPSVVADGGAESPIFLAVFNYNYGYIGGASALWARQRMANVFKIVAAVAIVAGTGAVVWTPAASRKFRLLGYDLSVSAAAALIFCDHVVGTPMLRSPLLAAAGVYGRDLGKFGLISATANNVLRLDVSANATVTGSVWGVEE